MPSSGMLRRVTLVRTDVSEELSAFFIRVTRIDELGRTHAAKKYQGISLQRASVASYS
jgi:demethoxyubiquinone hydroxylase (CLK1/Coq7/Cat5 family)